MTSYLNEAQIASRTLSYALALGRPVVSSPYWHAAEALRDGVGLPCPFGDCECFAREILPARRQRERSSWINVGRAYVDLVRRLLMRRAIAG